MALLVTTIITMMLSLIRDEPTTLQSFSLSAMYLVWLVLGSLSMLCLMRDFVNRSNPFIGYTVSILICIAVFLVVESVTQVLLKPEKPLPQYVNRGIAVLLGSILIIGFFSLLHRLERGAKAETLSRLQALQSRIRPHFLFNSLNTISELISVDAEVAEKSIQSLSSLFRASLDGVNDQHTLDQELRLCQAYVDLERWRLAERLDYSESVDVPLMDKWYVPKLILQPLVENAILHGVHSSEDGGMVALDVRETRNYLSLKVSNSLPNEPHPSNGAGIALDNIRERLLVMYDDDHYIKARIEEGLYSVVLRLPKRPRKVKL